MSETYTCYRCGRAIIFRCSRILPDGTVEHRARPFIIHVDGEPCRRATN